MSELDACSSNIDQLRQSATTVEDWEKVYEEEQKLHKTQMRAFEELTERLQNFKKSALKAEDPNKGYRPPPGSYACAGRFAELFAKLVDFKESWSMVKSIIDNSESSAVAAQNLKKANITHALRLWNEWKTFLEDFKDELSDLQSMSTSAFETQDQVSDDPLSQHALQVLADEVVSLHDHLETDLSREAARRANYEANFEDLCESQKKIVSWMLEQHKMLEALSNPEEVQEFTNSLHSNINVMNTNFLVLMELAEPLYPNEKVESLMEHISRLWFGLELLAFEKLTEMIMSQHASSGIEIQTQQWLEKGTELLEFLQEAKRLLDVTAEDSESTAAPLKELVNSLLADWDAYTIVVSHINRFTEREAEVRTYYESLRETIRSTLTVLSQVYNKRYDFPGKAEYMDRLGELSDYVQCMSQSDAWIHLRERVDKMQKLIDDSEPVNTNEERANYEDSY